MNVNVKGLDKVMRDFSVAGIKAQGNADKVTETYTRKMANDSADMAAGKSGDMSANIAASPHRLKPAVCEYGGTLPYTRPQEYEHKTKKGFIRKAVWKNRNDNREALKREGTKRERNRAGTR